MISFVDRNKCMIDGRTEDVMSLEPFCAKWEAFGFIVKEIDGNNINELCDAIEDNYLWHYGAFDDEKYEKAKASLEATYAKRVARAEKEGV